MIYCMYVHTQPCCARTTILLSHLSALKSHRQEWPFAKPQEAEEAALREEDDLEDEEEEDEEEEEEDEEEDVEDATEKEQPFTPHKEAAMRAELEKQGSPLQGGVFAV